MDDNQIRLTTEEMTGDRARFISIFKEKIHREGADNLLAYISSTDFFKAPASTRFHGSYPGGLCRHSLNVYDCLLMQSKALADKFGFKFTEESISIVALLHDLCKTDYYAESTRNVKNPDTGKWETVPYYTVEDKLPYGHGEKSVYMVSGYMKLTREEAFAIRWHMGFSSGDRDAANVGAAFEMYPLAFALSCADMEATYYCEGKGTAQ